MRLPATAFAVLALAAVAPRQARADGPPSFDDIIERAAAGARKARLQAAWMTLGAGAAEIAAGGAFLGALQPGGVRDVLPAVLFAAGGVEVALSLPLFLDQTRVEWQADGPWEKTPADLRTALDAESSERIAGIVMNSISLAAAGGGEAFVAAYPGLTGDERTGFAVAIGVVGALDVVLLVRAILSHPVRDAVHTYIGLNGTGVLATF